MILFGKKDRLNKERDCRSLHVTMFDKFSPVVELLHKNNAVIKKYWGKYWRFIYRKCTVVWKIFSRFLAVLAIRLLDLKFINLSVFVW